MVNPDFYDKIKYLANEADEDIILLGSSACSWTMIPDSISKPTGLSCFNGGDAGTSLRYSKIVLRELLRHHSPKAVVVSLNIRQLTYPDPKEGYARLIPYYGLLSPDYDNDLRLIYPNRKVLFHSNALLLNNNAIKIAAYSFAKKPEIHKGFNRHPSPRRSMQKLNDTIKPLRQEKVRDLIEMARLCNASGSQLFLIFPPCYLNFYNKRQLIQSLNQLAAKENFIFIDNSEFSPLSKPEDFLDNYHIHNDCAAEYSDSVGAMLQRYLRPVNP